MSKSTKYKLDNFFSSFGAAVNLSDKAKRGKHYFELVCIFANIIDGLLRLTLIMKEQLDSNSDIVNEKLLFQDDDDKKIMERTIYTNALNKKIITKAVYEKLNKLYDRRNKIIHRYIISDIKTLGVLDAAKKYDLMLSVITERHRKIHNELVAQNLGLAKMFIENPSAEQMKKQIMRKHKGLF
jgi:uncharacterized protein YutE (UPF0331/DUF86 family)